MSPIVSNLLIAIPALPLLATIVTALFGRRLGERSHLPIVVALVAAFLASFLLVAEVAKEAGESELKVGWEQTVDVWSWLTVDDAIATPAAAHAAADSPALPARLPFTIGVTLRADPLTAVMLAMVTFIASLVAIYASGYMHGDRGYWRFFTYVGLFVFSMTMLVSVSNFVLLYVFWEAVGLCSYLLIGFWYEKPEAASSAPPAARRRVIPSAPDACSRQAS